MVWAGRSAAPVARACWTTSAFQFCEDGITPPDCQVGQRPRGCRSRVLDPGELAERCDEAAPVGPLLVEHLAAGLGDPVVAAPAQAGFLDPAAADPAAIFHAVERRVERGQCEAQGATGSFLEQSRDLVAVMALALDDGQDHELGAAFLGFLEGTARHAGPLYEGELYITHLTLGRWQRRKGWR